MEASRQKRCGKGIPPVPFFNNAIRLSTKVCDSSAALLYQPAGRYRKYDIRLGAVSTDSNWSVFLKK